MVDNTRETRLLILLNSANHNGAVRQMSLWLPHLDPALWTVRVVFLREPGPLAEKLIPEGAAVESRILRSRFDPLVLIRLIRILRRHQPRIIFTIDERNAMILARLGGMATGADVVHAVHSTPPATEKRVSWWNLGTVNLCSGIVAVTEHHRRILAKMGIPENRIHVVVNAVHSSPDVSDAARSPSVVTAIFVGVLRHEKRIDILLRAFALIYRQYPHLRLSIVGSGPLESELKDLARDLNIQDRVDWHGWQMQVSSFLQRADFLVLPSEPGVETLSMAALEAMSLGLPVISTDVGSMRMAVVPETGIIVPPGDIKMMAEAMKTLAGNREMRRAMGKSARHRQQRLFSAERLRNDMNQFLTSMAVRR